MSGLISIRISKDLQTQMKRYNINWSDRVRTYLEAEVKQLELLTFLEKSAKKMKGAKIHADSTPLIRADRDSR